MVISTPIRRYLLGLAVGVISMKLILFGRLELEHYMHLTSPFALMVVPVVLAVWMGGFACGILTSLLGIVFGIYFFLPDSQGLYVTNVDYLLEIVLYFIQAIIVSAVIDYVRRLHFRSVRNLNARHASERELRERETRFRSLIENGEDVIATSLPGGKFTYVSPSVTRVLGYTPQELMGLDVEKLIHHDDIPEVQKALMPILDDPALIGKAVMRFKHKDGKWRWIESATTNLLAEPAVAALVTNFRDITASRQSAAALQASEERFRVVQEASTDGFMLFHSVRGDDGKIMDFEWVYTNKAGEKIVNRKAGELVGKLLLQELPGNVKLGLFDEFVQVVERGKPLSKEFYYEFDDLNKWFRIIAVPVEDGFGVSFIDLTERKRAQEIIEHQAFHDALTGLPNRALLQERLLQAINASKRSKELLTVLMVDLDKFKTVNDTLGHQTGDELLKVVAKRLQNCLRTEDTIARFGGDEFVIVLNQINNRDDVMKIVKTLQEALDEPIKLQGQDIRVGASIGATICPDDGRDAETLIKNADIALYSVKDSGRNNVVFFSDIQSS